MSHADLSMPNFLDDGRKELCRDIETMVQRLGCDYYANELLRKQNTDLKKEVQELLEDQESMQIELERKNKQIAGFIETIESTNQGRAQQGQDIRERFSSQANVVGMQYEIEILNSKIKSLERELNIQRNENERLRRANQQGNRAVK